jgi:mannose-1-phosphate guanylyltransferase
MSKDNGGRKLWSVILAGGEGDRIRPFIERWLGEPRPKQYCTFVGTRSLLQHTIDRADRLTGPEGRITVLARAHSFEIGSQFEGRARGKLVLQPANRDTAAGIFLPLTYVRVRAPSAFVVIYPSDHFVYPEAAFVEDVRRAVVAAAHLDRLILLGAVPDGPEIEYGWIEPGQELGWSLGYRVQQVQAFLEKPERSVAAAALASGGLWNTLVLASRVERLWSLGHQCFPDMMPLFEKLQEAIGTPAEEDVLSAVYEVLPRYNFSSDLLQRSPEQVAVVRLRGALWSDWGRPERIAETLRRIGKTPAFPLQHLAAV